MIVDVFGWLADGAHWTGMNGIPHRLLEHLGYSVGGLVIAALIGIPLGLYVGHTGKGTFAVAGTANALRALPSLGLLIAVVMVLQPRLGGNIALLLPCLIVLVVLAVPAVLTATYAGVRGVDPEARDAAYGMGMTGREVLLEVELPCAVPLIMSGLRSAMLQLIATAMIAAYVSLGGLGRYIIDGQAVRDYPQMLAGAILTALLALAVELVLAGVQRLVVPRGLSGRADGSRGRGSGNVSGTPATTEDAEEAALAPAS